MDKKYNIDIVIISYKGFDLTKNCIDSILNSKNIIPNIIVVDNNSADDTIVKLKGFFPEINYIVNEENLGYAKAINIGARYSTNEYLLLSNNDVVFFSDTIHKLIMEFEKNKKIGAIGAQQLYQNDNYQQSYGYNPSIKLIFYKLFFLDILLNKFNKYVKFKKIKKVDYIDGATILTTKEVFSSLNGFDESFFFYSEEADFCKRCQNLGFITVIDRNSKIIHFRGASTEGNLNTNNIALLVKSKLQLAKKYLKYSLKYYILSEKYQNYFLYFITHLIGKIFNINSFEIKSKIFKFYFDSWKKIN